MVMVGKVLALGVLPVALLAATTPVPVPAGEPVRVEVSLARPEQVAPGADPALVAPVYRAPVPGAVTRLFDPPLLRWGSGHRGVDLEALPGQEVLAPGAGRVVFAGTVVDRGVVTVLHPDGLRSSLEPVDPSVEVGTTLAAGEPVGVLQARSGHLGLHWGVRDGDTYLDPLGLLGEVAPVVLLPPDG